MNKKKLFRKFSTIGRVGKNKILMNRNYPLEERMVFFIYLTMIAATAVIVLMNIVDSIPFHKNYKWFGFITFVAIVAALYWNKIEWRRIIRNVSTIVTLYIIFPTLFFLSGGLRTAAIPYMIILLLAIVYSFSGKFRIWLMVTYILLAEGLMVINFLYPEIFPTVTDRAMFVDWITNFPLILIIIAILALWVSSEHKYEREKALRFSKDMEKLSTNDTLTGIYNRRYLETRVIELAKDCDAVCLFIFDIDRFKNINDGFGHAEGDRILVNVAKFMPIAFPGMTSIRFGGDEFLILFKGCISHNIHKMVKTFRKLLLDELGITISGGVVKYNGSLDESLARADKLLYDAKRDGRNKVNIED
ncbi:MAG: GGDEF domain-containing protein [Clostridiales bacterium]|nr:GGDEF domain-containing protein [Clostridiales bacterium]